MKIKLSELKRIIGTEVRRSLREGLSRDVYLQRLYTKIEAAGDLNGFNVTYEHPGYIKLHRPGDTFDISATPDHESEDMMPVDVSTDDGDVPFDAIVPFELTMDINTDVSEWRRIISELLPKIPMLQESTDFKVQRHKLMMSSM